MMEPTNQTGYIVTRGEGCDCYDICIDETPIVFGKLLGELGEVRCPNGSTVTEAQAVEAEDIHAAASWMGQMVIHARIGSTPTPQMVDEGEGLAIERRVT